MFKNYLKIAFRNFTRYKLFSFINVLGLAIGIFACLMIFLWVQKELSYDTFHSKADRIYRIERELFRDNLYSRWPITGGSYKQPLIDDFPEIENAVRFWRQEFSIKDYKNFVHPQRVYATDNSIFEVFDFGLEQGDESTALAKPKTVVLTREKAISFFGSDNVIGKSLTFEWDGQPVDFQVTGILKEIPPNSHIKFNMLISISSYPEERFADWRSNYLYTYILVKENISQSDLEEKLKTFVTQHLEPVYSDLLVGDVGIHDVLKMHIFPLTDIHLYPSANWEHEGGGNILSVYMFSSIAVLILVIACLNFMNLSTARSGKRAKEVSLRKTIGAEKNQLRGQFLMESILLAAIACIIAVDLTALFIPLFNSVFDEKLSAAVLIESQNIFALIGITLVVGIFAGLYPAFYLTKFNPISVLKGTLKPGAGKSAFRRNMVLIQFIISITLIVGMFTVYKQMQFIQNRSLGFNKENVVIIPVRSSNVTQNYESFRNKLLRSTHIISVSASGDVPSDRIYGDTGYTDDEDETNYSSVINIFVGFDFIDTYKMEVLAGRSFSRKFGSDSLWTIILNEAAVQKFGWKNDEAVGKTLEHRRGIKSQIVGVVKNFNFKSLHTKVEPLVMILAPGYYSSISVRIAAGNIEKTLDFIEQSWYNVFKGEQFSFNFLDDQLNSLYKNEKKTQNIFFMFSFLSLFVACLGLFGLAAFTAEARTKEMCIRKVLGASIPTIFSLLLNEFAKWVIVSAFIAGPIAYFMMNKWLQNFVYRVDLDIQTFIFAGGITLVIAFLTVSSQAIKTALANPVDSLKYE